MKIYFGVCGDKYRVLTPLFYDGITVPSGFEFDGVTVKAPFTFLFSNKDLRQGIRASCFHDWMCNHKDRYRRETATDVLVEIWRADGLEAWKAWFVRWSVNLYQWLKGWK